MSEEVMRITAIAAMDQKGLIGDGMKMPWHLPNDLKRFRKETLNKPVIMGRRTFETLPKPLDRRLNIVLTRGRTFNPDGCSVARTIEKALELARNHAAESGRREAVIIGGGVVFEETASLWDRLLLTVVEGQFVGDTYFPVAKMLKNRWKRVSSQFYEADENHLNAYTIINLEKHKTGTPLPDDFDLGAWLTNPEKFT